MKKIVVFLLLWLPMAVTLNAQSDDIVVGGTSDLQYDENVALAGNKTFNQIRGIQLNSHDHCKLFIELGVALSTEISDYGFGLNVAYVPDRWGAYGSIGAFDYNGFYATCGAVLRPVAETSIIDWQIYGGLAIGWYPGVEIGTRIGIGKGILSMCSISLSRVYVDRTRYTTLGLNIDLALLMSPLFLF